MEQVESRTEMRDTRTVSEGGSVIAQPRGPHRGAQFSFGWREGHGCSKEGKRPLKFSLSDPWFTPNLRRRLLILNRLSVIHRAVAMLNL